MRRRKIKLFNFQARVSIIDVTIFTQGKEITRIEEILVNLFIPMKTILRNKKKQQQDFREILIKSYRMIFILRYNYCFKPGNRKTWTIFSQTYLYMNKVIWKHKVLSKFSIFRWNFYSKLRNCKVFNTFDQLFKVRGSISNSTTFLYWIKSYKVFK